MDSDATTPACLDELALLHCIDPDTPVEPATLAHLEGCSACRRAVALAAADVAGRAPSRYRLLEPLGQGGFGSVALAHDDELGRLVALKLLRGPLRSEAVLQREARALARINHPNVVPVYDVGHLDGVPFLAMMHAPGGTLADWLRTDRSREDVLARFVEAGRGLAAAHAEGVVHGDFKPDNVLLAEDGRAMVADFGLARALCDPPRSTEALAGAPSFVAPEVERDGDKSAASDQYAFGVALRLAVQSGHALDPVVARMTAARPEARYPSMADATDALDAVRRGKPPSHARGWGLVLLGAAVVGMAALSLVSPSRTVERHTEGLALALSTSVCGVRPSVPLHDRAASLHEARAALSAGAFAEAEVLSRDALREARRRDHRGATVRAALLLGAATSSQGKSRQAVGHYDDAALAAVAIGCDVAAVDAWTREATTLIQMGDVSSARRVLRAARAFAQRRPEVSRMAFLVARGSADLHEAVGDYPAAEADYREALTLAMHDSDIARVRLSLSSALLWSDKPDQARPLLEQVLDTPPQRPAALGLLVRVAHAQGDLPAAVRFATVAIDEAIEADVGGTNLAVLYNTRAIPRMESDDLEGARADLQRAIELYRAALGDTSPTTANGLYALGELELKAEDYAEAEALFSAARLGAVASENPAFIGAVDLGLCKLAHATKTADRTACTRAKETLSKVFPVGQSLRAEAERLADD